MVQRKRADMTELKMSLYLVIGENIKRKIGAGILKAGDKLPSCRQLADELGVNPNTVQKAYSRLEADGVVFTIVKKGVFVSSTHHPKVDKNKLLAIKLNELKTMGYSLDEIVACANDLFRAHTSTTTV